MHRKFRTEPKEIDSLAPKDDLLVVAIGASASGIEAITELVRHLPPDTGMAFVLIQHLDPTPTASWLSWFRKRPRWKCAKSRTACGWQRTAST
jgi:chemotaxis response regulator CheB